VTASLNPAGWSAGLAEHPGGSIRGLHIICRRHCAVHAEQHTGLVIASTM